MKKGHDVHVYLFVINIHLMYLTVDLFLCFCITMIIFAVPKVSICYAKLSENMQNYFFYKIIIFILETISVNFLYNISIYTCHII